MFNTISIFDSLRTLWCTTLSLKGFGPHSSRFQTSSGMKCFVPSSLKTSFGWSIQPKPELGHWRQFLRLGCSVGHPSVITCILQPLQSSFTDQGLVEGSSQKPLFHKFLRTFHLLDLLSYQQIIEPLRQRKSMT